MTHGSPQADVRRRRVSRRWNGTRQYFLAAVCVLLAVVLVPTSLGQGSDIVIGGQAFRVGMSRADAMTRLDTCCHLTGGDNSFFIWTKNGPPSEILGGIWFSGGRVSMLRLDRAHSEDPTTAAFALSLYPILLESTTPNPSAATIGTSTTELANGTERAITIRFASGKSITMSVGSLDGRASGFGQISEERQAR